MVRGPLEDKPGTDGDEASRSEKRHRVGPQKEMTTRIDELIAEAIEEGHFDDLPGHGRPLDLSTNPFSGDAELAYRLLKDNDYTLPWIAERKAILERIEAFRGEIRRTWPRFRAEYQAARDEFIRASLSVGWREHLEQWRAEIEELNKLIAETNFKQPGEQLEILKLTLDSELRRAGAIGELT